MNTPVTPTFGAGEVRGLLNGTPQEIAAAYRQAFPPGQDNTQGFAAAKRALGEAVPAIISAQRKAEMERILDETKDNPDAFAQAITRLRTQPDPGAPQTSPSSAADLLKKLDEMGPLGGILKVILAMFNPELGRQMGLERQAGNVPPRPGQPGASPPSSPAGPPAAGPPTSSSPPDRPPAPPGAPAALTIDQAMQLETVELSASETEFLQASYDSVVASNAQLEDGEPVVYKMDNGKSYIVSKNGDGELEVRDVTGREVTGTTARVEVGPTYEHPDSMAAKAGRGGVAFKVDDLPENILIPNGQDGYIDLDDYKGKDQYIGVAKNPDGTYNISVQDESSITIYSGIDGMDIDPSLRQTFDSALGNVRPPAVEPAVYTPPEQRSGLNYA